MKNGTEFDINTVSTELIRLDRETIKMFRSLDVKESKAALYAYQNIEGEKACEGLENVMEMVNNIVSESEIKEAIKRNLNRIKSILEEVIAYCNE